MSIFKKWSFQNLSNEIFSPKANGVEAKIEEVKQKLPTPVFGLFR